MFVDITQPFRKGDTVKGQIRFDKAGDLDIDYKVEALGAPRPSPSGHTH